MDINAALARPSGLGVATVLGTASGVLVLCLVFQFVVPTLNSAADSYRALLTKPQTIMLDEPFTSLDLPERMFLIDCPNRHFSEMEASDADGDPRCRGSRGDSGSDRSDWQPAAMASR